jgi:hypothetical protein
VVNVGNTITPSDCAHIITPSRCSRCSS